MGVCARLMYGIALLCLLFRSSPGSAQTNNCTLVQMGSLDILSAAGGGIAVKVGLEGGVSAVFVVNLASARSAIDERLATKLGLSLLALPGGEIIFFHGRRVHARARLPILKLDRTTINDALLTVLPDDVTNEASGILGDDVLSNFDIDLDFAHKKLNLFSQRHCPGRVVYWAKSYHAIALNYVAGSFTAPVGVDGKVINMLFDTTSANSSLDIRETSELFNVGLGTPGVAPVKNDRPAWDKERYYTSPFQQLRMGGFVVSDPDLELVDSSDAERHSWYEVESALEAQGAATTANGQNEYVVPYGSMANLSLGVRDLEHFHLYIAFGEKTLYLTPATGLYPVRR